MVRVRTALARQEVASVHEAEHRARPSLLARTDLDQHQLSGHSSAQPLRDYARAQPGKIETDLRPVAEECYRQRDEAVLPHGVHLGAVQRQVGRGQRM